MDSLSCCGKNFVNKHILKRHRKIHHTMASPIFKCFLGGCFRRFNYINEFKEHQNSYIYNSNIFYTQTQAFNRTTLVLRRNLTGEALENFEFLTSEHTIEEVKRILFYYSPDNWQTKTCTNYWFVNVVGKTQ